MALEAARIENERIASVVREETPEQVLPDSYAEHSPLLSPTAPITGAQLRQSFAHAPDGAEQPVSPIVCLEKRQMVRPTQKKQIC